jgi:hypothetical protein
MSIKWATPSEEELARRKPAEVPKPVKKPQGKSKE